MTRGQLAGALAITLALAATATPRADVKTQQKSQVKFEGMLGRMVGLFGGKAAREGVVSTVAVKGDRKATFSDYGGSIIDLAEEKVYDIDVKGKSYKVTTFAELRRQMQEAQEKARKEQAKAAGKEEEPQEKGKEYEVDVSVKDTGQSKTLNGYPCKEQVTTITVREKGKTLEQAGGIVMTADSWLAPKIAALDEIRDFDRRYAEKLEGPAMLGSAEQMAAAMAMWPGLQQAFAKYQAQGGTMSGTPILTTVTVDGVKSQEEAQQTTKQDEERPSGGLGGMLGGLGKRMAKKKPDEGAAGGGRSTIMTTDTEILSVTPTVAPDEVAVPAGFKLKK